MLTSPSPSPFDLNFRLAGFPVRISFTFWIGSILFGYGLVRMVDASMADASPSIAVLLVLWAICMLVSIGVHELGHALMFRVFGVRSRIVLYHLGGLAIPEGGARGPASSLSPAQDLAVSASGPLAQLATAVALVAALRGGGYYVDGMKLVPGDLGDWINSPEARPLPSPLARGLVVFYLLPSVFWAVLNCVPVFPLDGGRVLRSLVELVDAPESIWLWVGVVVGGGLAFYGYRNDRWFLAIMFALLAMGNYQTAMSRRH